MKDLSIFWTAKSKLRYIFIFIYVFIFIVCKTKDLSIFLIDKVKLK